MRNFGGSQNSKIIYYGRICGNDQDQDQDLKGLRLLELCILRLKRKEGPSPLVRVGTIESVSRREAMGVRLSV